MAKNADLTGAKSAKKDEFYTQLIDIENEVKHYRKHFKGATVLCNCDDPECSNFYFFFRDNFEFLGLKKLISTCYKNTDWFQFSEEKDEKAVCQIYTGRQNKPETRILSGGGSFRSEECIEFLKECDIVCTNPPFSKFREFVALLMKYGKKFLIIGNVNSITCKEVFPYVMRNEIWLGASIHSGDREFMVPDDYPLEAASWRVDDKGRKFIRVKGVRWFTNLDYKERHDDIPLFRHYTSAEYEAFDNYNAINVGKTEDIPCDYEGVMGVPVTFFDKYNPDQFEILGITKTWFGGASKTYPPQIQIKDGKRGKRPVTKLNDGAVLSVKSPPERKTYYVIDGQYYVQTYPRVLIRRKRSTK